MCGHKTEKVVLPEQCGGSKKSLFSLDVFRDPLLVDEVEILCIQPAAANLHSSTTSRTTYLQRGKQAWDR